MLYQASFVVRFTAKSVPREGRTEYAYLTVGHHTSNDIFDVIGIRLVEELNWKATQKKIFLHPRHSKEDTYPAGWVPPLRLPRRALPAAGVEAVSCDETKQKNIQTLYKSNTKPF